MSLPIVFRRVARIEMNEAIAWYEYQGAGLGLELASEIDTYLRFPYTIHFLDETTRIVVFAVFHVKRNPRVLEGR